MQIAEFSDFVGVESSADLESEVGAPPHGGSLGRRHRRSAAVHKEFPPPISWLARTENLPSHMPWEMKKYRTSDGRLVIKEVKRHEYFLADRSNGRLVLNLIHVEGGGGQKYCDAAEEENDGGDEGKCHLTVEEVASECYKYNGVSCGGFVATAPVFMPPVPI